MIEIRWHGRGGQGAKTAALLLADAAFATGMYVQGFPEYGPERMGAPITAYNRLDDKQIRVHSNIYEPDMVVVVDETLIGPVDVTKGLGNDGKVIVNTNREPDEVKKMFGNFDGEIYAIDAGEISVRTIGKNLPNTPLLSAVVKAGEIMSQEDLFKNMEESFGHKFASKPEVIKGNMNAIKEAWMGAILI